MNDTDLMLTIWKRFFEFIAVLFAAVGGVAVFILMAITDIAVVARYFMNNPIFGIEDISVLVLTVIVAASVAYGAWTQSHISVELVELFAGRRTIRICGILAQLLGAGTAGYIAYALATIGSCGFSVRSGDRQSIDYACAFLLLSRSIHDILFSGSVIPIGARSGSLEKFTHE